MAYYLAECCLSLRRSFRQILAPFTNFRFKRFVGFHTFIFVACLVICSCSSLSYADRITHHTIPDNLPPSTHRNSTFPKAASAIQQPKHFLSYPDGTETGLSAGVLFFLWGSILILYILSKLSGLSGNLIFGHGGSRVGPTCGLILTAWVLLNLWHTITQTTSLSLLRCGQYFLAGGFCALITHAVCVPIDVVKTRLQLKAYEGKYRNMSDAFMKIAKEEGVSALGKGLGATSWGYFLHGAFKYCGYEIFKVVLSVSGRDTPDSPSLGVSAGSGFLAECVACILLCPMEAVRIRSVADPGFPHGVFAGLALITKTEGFVSGLYKGLPSILLKQVPYTVGQFASYEFAVVLVRFFVMAMLGIEGGNQGVPKRYAPIVATCAGFLAGVMAAIISHPGDTILSKVNQEASSSSVSSSNYIDLDGDDAMSNNDQPLSGWLHVVKIARQQGVRGLFLGLGARLIQVSCIVGGQFLIYDSIKLWCGIIPASARMSMTGQGHSAS